MDFWFPRCTQLINSWVFWISQHNAHLSDNDESSACDGASTAVFSFETTRLQIKFNGSFGGVEWGVQEKRREKKMKEKGEEGNNDEREGGTVQPKRGREKR